jgi:hypothetical protein
VPDEHEPRKGRLPSHAGRGALWLTGTVIAALIAALLGAYFSGGLSNFTAQKTQSDDVKRVVDDFLAAVKRGQPDAADRLTGGAKSRQWKAWDPAADPVVWMSRVAIDPDVKTADSARAYAKPSVWGFRRAEAGCRELGEAFHLVSRDGRWLIDELPGLGGRCGERLMAARGRRTDPRASNAGNARTFSALTSCAPGSPLPSWAKMPTRRSTRAAALVRHRRCRRRL